MFQNKKECDENYTTSSYEVSCEIARFLIYDDLMKIRSLNKTDYSFMAREHFGKCLPVLCLKKDEKLMQNPHWNFTYEENYKRNVFNTQQLRQI